MVMKFIFVMDKHTLNKQGFTIIEVLLCLSITIVLSMLSMPQFFTKRAISIEEQYVSVRSLLEEAKTTALLYHQKVTMHINSNVIEYQCDTFSRKLVLDEQYYFENSNEVHFNQNGNINQGNTISLCNQEQCRSIVFNVGSGDFYLK